MVNKRWRLLLFGEPKTGKTSLAETAPGPRLILDAEGGTDWLSSDTVTWDPTQGAPPAVEGDVSVVVHVLNWEMIERVTRWLQKGEHSFRSVILDSLTELQKQAKRSISDTGFQLKDWGQLYDKMDAPLRDIRDLTKLPGSPVDVVIITALANHREDRVVPDIQGSMARSLAGQMDTIAYLRPGTMRSDGTVGRELIVDARQGITAGDRTKILRRQFHGVVPVDLDEETDTMTWNINQMLELMNRD